MCFSDDFAFKVLPLSASIKRGEFFSYSIKELKFDENYFTISYDLGEGKFEPAITNLNIISTVPDVMSDVSYFVELKSENSICIPFSADSLPVAEGFAHYFLSDQEVIKGSALSFPSFSESTGGFHSDRLAFRIEFDVLDRNIAEKTNCNGQAVFVAGLEL